MEEANVSNNLGPDTPVPPAKAVLPWRKALPIYIALWCEAFNSSSIFSYVGYMILDFGMSKSESDSSYMYYAGILGSSYFAAHLLSSFFWGTLSDRIGRRPILLFGQCGSMCASILFGLSQKYYWAVAARSLSGLLNGSVGVSKTYLGEICDSSNVALAFSYIGLMWGFGSIAGSVLGGLLSRPAKQYPSHFSETGIFGRYPYLIPNLFAALVTLIGFILCFLFLNENERKRHGPTAKENELRQELGLASTSESDETISRSNSRTVMLANEGHGSQDEGMIELDEVPDSPKSVDSIDLGSSSSSSSSSQENDEAVVRLDANEANSVTFAGESSWSSLSDASLPWYRRGWVGKVTQLPGYIYSLPIFHERLAVLTCLAYCVWGSINTMADEIWPLWALTPIQEGGLAFTTKLIGICNAWAGATNLIFNLIIYPHLVKRFGLTFVFRIGVVGSIFVYPLYPMIKYVPLPVTGVVFSYIRFWGLLGILIFFRFCLSQAGFSTVMTLISNSVYPETMGSANGLGQSLVALGRMLAPFTAAAILAACTGSKAVWPFNYGRLAWWSISLAILVALYLSFKLPTSLNKPRIEAEADKNAALIANTNFTVSVDEEDMNRNNTAPSLSTGDNVSNNLDEEHEREETEKLEF